MKTMRLFLVACLCAAAFTACSKEENGVTDSEPELQGDFSLIAPNGKFYTNGQVVPVSSVDETGTMRLEFGLKNNTKERLTLTMSQKILSSNYDQIANHATFCWDACYSNLPLKEGFIATQVVIAEGKPLGEPSGDMMNIDTTTPSFEAKVEYTITNPATKEKRTLIGDYKYTKK